MTNRRDFLSKTVAAAAGAALSCTGSTADPLGRAVPEWPPSHSPDEDEYWDLVRAQFPLTRDRIYLNTGGLGPAPYPVLDTMLAKIMELQRVSETGHHDLHIAREKLAPFIGADAEELAFMRNATEGNATVASGLALTKGDEVIFESHAHPGGAIAWMVRQKEDGVKVKIFEPSSSSAEENLERLNELVTPATRVIQVSHITAPTGIRMPVEGIRKIADRVGAWFHIDGAQSAGMIDFKLHAIGCDSFATSGHKWLGAPHGTGFLYVKKDRLDEVRPTEAGAYSDSGYALPDVFEYAETAERYEPGTRDAASILAFGAAIDFHTSIGQTRIEEYVVGLGRYLRGLLSSIDGVTVISPDSSEMDTAMSTIQMEGVDNRDLYSYLVREQKLRCRIVDEQGLNALRISTHIFNSREDCDRVAEGIRAARDR